MASGLFLRRPAPRARWRRQAGEGSGWIENGPEITSRTVDLREIWQFRDLVGFLALRDLQVRYKQAAFGVAWAVLQPLAGSLVLVVLFHRLAHLPTRGLPYLPFTVVGFAGWTYFSTTVTAMTASFVANAALVTKVYYPRIATPLAALLTGAVDLAVAIAVGEVAALASGTMPPLQLLLLPCWLVALALTTLAVGLPLATLYVRFRDVGPLVGFSIGLLLFLTPVAYASSAVPSNWQWPYHLNPMVAVIDGLRWSMLGGPGPAASDLASLAVAVLALVLGLRYFAASQRRFADLI